MTDTPALPSIAILGAGSMGGAILHGLVRSGLAASGVTATNRTAAKAAELDGLAGVTSIALEAQPAGNTDAAAAADVWRKGRSRGGRQPSSCSAGGPAPAGEVPGVAGGHEPEPTMVPAGQTRCGAATGVKSLRVVHRGLCDGGSESRSPTAGPLSGNRDGELELSGRAPGGAGGHEGR